MFTYPVQPICTFSCTSVFLLIFIIHSILYCIFYLIADLLILFYYLFPFSFSPIFIYIFSCVMFNCFIAYFIFYFLLLVLLFFFFTFHWADLSWPTFHYWLYPVWLCMWQIIKNEPNLQDRAVFAMCSLKVSWSSKITPRRSLCQVEL